MQRGEVFFDQNEKNTISENTRTLILKMLQPRKNKRISFTEMYHQF